MNTNTLKIIIFFCLLFVANTKAWALPCSFFNQDPLHPHEIANILGWVPTPTNLCGGFYKEPAIVLTCAKPAAIDAATTTIVAERTVSFSTTGTSQLEGNVEVTQPGRKMVAQKATLYRNPTTHEIAQIVLEGDVHYYEPGKQLVAQRVYVDVEKKYVHLCDVLYRLAKPTPREVLNAWGKADSVIRKSDTDITLTNASYTTCSPVNQTWVLSASRIRINREIGWGEAVNSYLSIHDWPILWVPYFSFPVDKRRKTGFLFPTFAYSDQNGVHVSFPYYLNLAPNYDATIIPSYIYRRGMQFETHFRYITCNTNGQFDIEYIPYDSNFAAFRRNAPEIYGVNANTIPFLNRLEKDSNSRGAFAFSHGFTDKFHWISPWCLKNDAKV